MNSNDVNPAPARRCWRRPDWGVLSLFLGLLVISAGCGQAALENIMHPRDAANPPKELGEGQTEPRTEPDPPAEEPRFGLPTARVEVILDGKPVVRVPINREVILQPSRDTLDSDDVGRDNCVNPGIVRSDFNVAEQNLQRQRQQGCEALSVPHTFAEVGVYTVSMTVTTDEGETATASLAVTAFDPAAAAPRGGFEVWAYPLLARVGEEVQFGGRCNISVPSTISWDFGDTGKAEGADVKHSYAAQGQYQARGVCVAGEDRYESHLTIVVLDNLPAGRDAALGGSGIFDGRRDGDDVVIRPGDDVEPGDPFDGGDNTQQPGDPCNPHGAQTPSGGDPAQIQAPDCGDLGPQQVR